MWTQELIGAGDRGENEFLHLKTQHRGFMLNFISDADWQYEEADQP